MRAARAKGVKYFLSVTFRNGFMPPLLQLNLFGACIALVSSGKFHASRFVSEFEIESCSRSSSYKLPPRAADALDIIPASIQSSIWFCLWIRDYLVYRECMYVIGMCKRINNICGSTNVCE